MSKYTSVTLTYSHSYYTYLVIELPVDCPVYPAEVNVTSFPCTYTLPAFGADNVKVTNGISYFPHGSYVVTRWPSDQLTTCGINAVVAVIRDDALNKICWAFIQVIGESGAPPETPSSASPRYCGSGWYIYVPVLLSVWSYRSLVGRL